MPKVAFLISSPIEISVSGQSYSIISFILSILIFSILIFIFYCIYLYVKNRQLFFVTTKSWLDDLKHGYIRAEMPK